MSGKEFDRHKRLMRVRLVAYDFLTPTQQHRSLPLPDLSPTPSMTPGLYTIHTPNVLSPMKMRKPPLRRIILLYD
ncbi:MAG TPA: hypothetical protein DHW02_24350 [Ktedonobacter sp.]|nr:hypothetical protein [Ktedonobacter sp.]